MILAWGFGGPRPLTYRTPGAPPLHAAGGAVVPSGELRFEDAALRYMQYMCRSGDAAAALLQAAVDQLAQLRGEVADLRHAAAAQAAAAQQAAAQQAQAQQHQQQQVLQQAAAAAAATATAPAPTERGWSQCLAGATSQKHLYAAAAASAGLGAALVFCLRGRRSAPALLS